MAKSSRSSQIKTNRKHLKARVFGPHEQARAERLNKKMMEIISQPKPKVEEKAEDVKNMETENNETELADDAVMDVDKTAPTSSRKAEKRRKLQKKAGIEKKKRVKTINKMAFSKKRVTKR